MGQEQPSPMGSEPSVPSMHSVPPERSAIRARVGSGELPLRIEGTRGRIGHWGPGSGSSPGSVSPDFIRPGSFFLEYVPGAAGSGGGGVSWEGVSEEAGAAVAILPGSFFLEDVPGAGESEVEGPSAAAPSARFFFERLRGFRAAAGPAAPERILPGSFFLE